ncbi:MAG TPA: hypothetical protein VI318_23545 [Baekduia sp.]
MSQQPMTPLTANVTRSQSDQLVTHWYGWFWVVSSLFWPRICLLTMWIFGGLVGDAFDHRSVLTVGGFLLLPWTTLGYALMWGLTSDGVFGWEWAVVAFSLFLDLVTYIEARYLVTN